MWVGFVFNICHYGLSITALMGRAGWGWGEVNKWQTNKREGGPLFYRPTFLLCRISPRCVMGNSWWKWWLLGSHWGGSVHFSLHTAVLAIHKPSPLTLQKPSRYTLVRNAAWLLPCSSFSFPVTSTLIRGFTRLPMLPWLVKNCSRLSRERLQLRKKKKKNYKWIQV